MEKDTHAVSSVKLWLFPSIVTLISIITWTEVKEIKSDLKALLAQANQDKVRIENLERVIYKGKGSLTAIPQKPEDLPQPIRFMLTEFIVPVKDDVCIVEDEDDEEET